MQLVRSQPAAGATPSFRQKSDGGGLRWLGSYGGYLVSGELSEPPRCLIPPIHHPLKREISASPAADPNTCVYIYIYINNINNDNNHNNQTWLNAGDVDVEPIRGPPVDREINNNNNNNNNYY